LSEDNTFTVGTSEITVKRNGSIRLIPIGDQHCSSKGHDPERYQATLAECKKDPDAYFFLMGDEHDLASFSERRSIRNAGLHESTLHDLDQRALDKCHSFVKQHLWMKGRILFMLQGNHYWTFSSHSIEDGIEPGMSSTQWIANKLGTRWAGWLTYHRVLLKAADKACTYTIDIVASHGKAGGKLVGSAYNQVSELRGIFPGADIYAMGHDHKRGAVPDSTLYASHGRGDDGLPVIKQRRQWMLRTGSFLRGYIQGEAGYIVGRLLRRSQPLPSMTPSAICRASRDTQHPFPRCNTHNRHVTPILKMPVTLNTSLIKHLC